MLNLIHSNKEVKEWFFDLQKPLNKLKDNEDFLSLKKYLIDTSIIFINTNKSRSEKILTFLNLLSLIEDNREFLHNLNSNNIFSIKEKDSFDSSVITELKMVGRF